ncbi:MAG: aldo/keto reductase [Chloroflexi bacterium]|nr:aldo/keto reductase [Chloroflexota bacterium]
MRYRPFGGTGLTVSTVSMGCNRLGDPGTDWAQWPPVVRQALELGVTFFDTSNSYNQGRSESVLGEVLSAHPAPVVVSTKGGVPVETNDFPRREFTAATILAAAEDSLHRLRRDTIDLYMLHSPSVAQLERDDWAIAIDQLKARGKVRCFGISTHDHASGIWALQHGAEFLQIEYDLLNPTAADALLPLAERLGAGIMVRTPLARGLLSGKFPVGQPLPAEQQWRRPSGDQLQLRLRRIEQLRFLERPGQTLAQAAIRFVLSHPAIHCAIPGANSLAQLADNVSAADADLTTDELARIRALHAAWRAEGHW